jgi:hypothetical protein
MVISPVGYGISTLVFARKCRRYQFLSRHQTLCLDLDPTQCADCSYRRSVEQSVTLAVVANKKGLKIRFASVKLSVAELLTLIKARAGSENVIFLSGCVVLLTEHFLVRIPRIQHRGLQFLHATPCDLPSQGIAIVPCGQSLLSNCPW